MSVFTYGSNPICKCPICKKDFKQGILREKDGIPYWLCLACAQKNKANDEQVTGKLEKEGDEK